MCMCIPSYLIQQKDLITGSSEVWEGHHAGLSTYTVDEIIFPQTALGIGFNAFPNDKF